MKRRRIRQFVGSAFGAIALSGASGCYDLHGKAVTAASNAWSCPEGRTSAVALGAPSEAPPAADVAADPARLAIWQKNPGFVRKLSGASGRWGILTRRVGPAISSILSARGGYRIAILTALLMGY
jgi:hypothetical protein